jgi:outer membrane lipoprotein SlyB
MDPIKTTNGRSRIHPLVATAAGAVIVACGVGVAAMTGILPHASSTPEPAPPITAMAPAGVTTPAPAPLAPAKLAQSTQNIPPPPPYQPVPQAAAPAPVPAPAICHTCGVVTSVAAYKVEGHGTGIGAVGGAVAGGLVGHAFGGGNGRTATTLLGALGGGLAGNAVERNVRSSTSYRVHVRMEDGTYRTFNYASTPPVSQGSRVRIVNGVLRNG